MSRKLSDLTPELEMRTRALLHKAEEMGIEITIVDTLRTKEEHIVNLAAGTSWIKESLHLPGPDGKSRGIDICPTEYLPMKGWNPKGLYWTVLGKLGKSFKLGWGGDWIKKDLGHFEWRGNVET